MDIVGNMESTHGHQAERIRNEIGKGAGTNIILGAIVSVLGLAFVGWACVLILLHLASDAPVRATKPVYYGGAAIFMTAVGGWRLHKGIARAITGRRYGDAFLVLDEPAAQLGQHIRGSLHLPSVFGPTSPVEWRVDCVAIYSRNWVDKREQSLWGHRVPHVDRDRLPDPNVVPIDVEAPAGLLPSFPTSGSSVDDESRADLTLRLQQMPGYPGDDCSLQAVVWTVALKPGPFGAEVGRFPIPVRG